MAQPQPTDQQRQAFLAALIAYQASTQTLRANLSDRIRAMWASLGSYRQQDMRRFVTQVVPLVGGAQQAMSSLTVANLAHQRQIALGGRFTPPAVSTRGVTGAAARNGTPPADVYSRPFHLVWRQLAELPHEPGSIEQAITAGENRAVDLAVTDLQLAKQRTAHQVIAHDEKVTGYRRVLEGAHSCGLCVVAATRRYHRAELLPMHPACDCSVAPVWSTSDPGGLIEAAANVNGQIVPIADLPGVHDRIEQRFGRSSSGAGAIRGVRNAKGDLVQYRDVLITHEHGELGPVLAVRGAEFIGPDDL